MKVVYILGTFLSIDQAVSYSKYFIIYQTTAEKVMYYVAMLHTSK